MRKYYLLLILFSYCYSSCNSAPAISSTVDTPTDSVKTIKSGLNYPWEILWGKDDHIWMTERGGKVSKIDPKSGATVFSSSIAEVERAIAVGMDPAKITFSGPAKRDAVRNQPVKIEEIQERREISIPLARHQQQAEQRQRAEQRQNRARPERRDNVQGALKEGSWLHQGNADEKIMINQPFPPFTSGECALAGKGRRRVTLGADS